MDNSCLFVVSFPQGVDKRHFLGLLSLGCGFSFSHDAVANASNVNAVTKIAFAFFISL